MFKSPNYELDLHLLYKSLSNVVHINQTYQKWISLLTRLEWVESTSCLDICSLVLTKCTKFIFSQWLFFISLLWKLMLALVIWFYSLKMVYVTSEVVIRTRSKPVIGIAQAGWYRLLYLLLWESGLSDVYGQKSRTLKILLYL